jgi:hypothetical protein
MNRELEPEPMTDVEQALAQAAADFASVDQAFWGAARGYFPTLKRKWQISPSCTS